MNISLKVMVVLAVVLTASCSTTSVKEYAQEQQTLFERQMEDSKDCSPDQSCLGDILVSEPDLHNHKTKAAYNKEHKVVMKVVQSVKDCMAENKVWNEHGFPSKENCSNLAEEKRNRAIGKGGVPKSAGLGVGSGRKTAKGGSYTDVVVVRSSPWAYVPVYSPYGYRSYGAYGTYSYRRHYTHRDYSTHRPPSVSSEFSHGRERMHNDFKNAHR